MCVARRVSLPVVVALGLLAETAWPCEHCLRLGTSALHVGVAAADDFEDALSPPSPPPVNPDGGFAQFIRQGGTFPQPGGPGTRVDITYSFNNLLDGGLTDINGVSLPASLIRSSVEEAFRVWARHAPLHFREVPDEGGGPYIGNYPDGQFGQIRLSHIYMNGPDEPGELPKAKAQAYFFNTFTNIAGDIFFDNGDPWQEAGTLSRPDILGAAIHEIGHTLGLGHTNVVGANMYWIFHRFSGLGTGQLFDDDIAGIQSIYGEGRGSVTPLSLPVPEPSAFVLTFLAAMSGLCHKRRR
jgi:hypothetical protein